MPSALVDVDVGNSQHQVCIRAWMMSIARVCTFKALLQVWLDIHGVLGLAQNLKQVIAGQEVEARELLALVLQVVFQALLYVLQLALYICEALKDTRRCAGLRVWHTNLHGILPW